MNVMKYKQNAILYANRVYEINYRINSNSFINEAINSKGEKLYKLAEGYMPAQTIYIFSNPYDKSINCGIITKRRIGYSELRFYQL